MMLYIKQISPISYYIQPKKSKTWSALFPKPVYSLSSVFNTECHTHTYENTV